jgi:site-specific recombinase XerD
LGDTFSHLAEWRAWLDVTYAPGTVDDYWDAAWRYLGKFPKPLHEHQEADCARWLESFPQRSASRMLGYHALKALFTWAKRNRLVCVNPVEHLKPLPPEEKAARALTIEQYEAIRDAAHARSPIRGFTVELLYHTGGRITEIRMLTWAQVAPDGLRFEKTKGGRERVVPWSEGLRRAVDGLRTYFGDEPHLIPRSGQQIGRWLKDAAESAGYPRDEIHAHLFRSTAITHMLRGGAKLKAVGSVVGHQNIRTTNRYVADFEDDRIDAVAVLDRGV